MERRYVILRKLPEPSYPAAAVGWFREQVAALDGRLGGGALMWINEAAVTEHLIPLLDYVDLIASVDTRPKDGDGEAAPLASGAVGEAETPAPKPMEEGST